MDKILFNDQVAVITGAGQGLGKSYAELLASRGACVIINDYANGTDGKPLAEEVADAINLSGGRAIASTDDIAHRAGAENLCKTTCERFGKIDIFIHNAGLLINKPFFEMEGDDWTRVLDVHLNGAYYLLKQVLPVMVENDYGRIVMITSSVGMFGIGSHVNYGAAKMGVIGLVQTLKTEIEHLNIKCNLVSPLAATSQTSQAIDESLHDIYRPESVAPIVAYLCSSLCTSHGYIYVAGGGYFSRIGIYEGNGVYIEPERLSIEAVAARINDISDMSASVHVSSINQAAKKLFKSIYKGQHQHAS